MKYLPAAAALAVLLVPANPVRAQSYTFTSVANTYAAQMGIALDPSGGFFVSGFYNHTIYKFSATGILLAQYGTGFAGNSDGSGSTVRFNNPRGLALDSAGNLYVGDSNNHTIRKITPAGVVSTFAGLAGTIGSTDGAGSAARFNYPQGLGFDRAGNLYVADTNNHTIRRITPAGVVSTFAGSPGVSGSADGTGAAARFNLPLGLAVDTAGNVYVADTSNSTIRKITPAGAVTTLAGSALNPGNTDGPAALARFFTPWGVAVDAAGNVFVADTNNTTVRKISGGVVTTLGGLAGNGGDVSGMGSAARFYGPRGVAVDASGTLYVSDSGLLKLGTPSSQPTITVQPFPLQVGTGSTALFSVTATGAAPITYQWQKDGTSIPGATAATLTLPSVQAGATGNYSVVVANPVGTLVSVAANLSVVAAVPNDNFANASVLSSSEGQISGNNNGATGERGEPTHFSPTATFTSIWFRWVAPESGTAVFSATTSNFPVAMAVYTGDSLDTLVRVVQGSNTLPSFHATKGTTYYVAAGATNTGSRGTVNLTWRTILNDDFANAQPIPGDSGSVTGHTFGATIEAGEQSDVVTVWYRWTAPQDGVAIFDVEMGATLAVYTGSTLASRASPGPTSFAPAPNNRGTLHFVARAGTTYTIAVGRYGYVNVPFTLNWRVTDQPVVVSASGNVTAAVGSTATLSVTALSFLPLEYRWGVQDTPRTSHRVFNTDGSSGPTLTLINVQPADSGLYSVTVINSAGSTERQVGSLNVLVPPSNDNFANAAAVSGLSGRATGTNVNATGETGEPAHWNLSGTASSVWFKWTASTSGLAALDTIGSNFDTVLAVYTGSSLGSLTRLAQDDDRGGGRTSLVSFAAIAGTTYFIAVGGATSGARGNIVLNWQLSPTLAVATPPASQTIAVGGSATFSVQAAGTGVTYQWNRNGVPIPGATANTLTVANVQPGSDASYTVTLTNTSGSVTSEPATLAVAAPQLTTLAIRNARNGGALLWSIAGHANTLVAVGNNGAILSSSDNGGTWAPRNSGTTAWLVGATFGAGQFVAVGDGGLILTSTDATTWTPAIYSGTTQRLNNVLYADGKFVAVGERGTVLTSTDARTWTPRISGTTNWLHGLAYNPRIGSFATTGQGGVFLYSSDGTLWNKLPIADLTADLEAVAAVESYAQFVAIGQDGVVAAIHQDRIVTKSGETLITWSGEAGATGTGVRLRGLAQGASALFATGEDGKVITAPDYRGPWFTLPSGTTGNLLAGLYHNNTLFIVGEDEIALQSDPLFSSRLVNISTRGQVGTGGNVMISGFVITGDRPKQVLVRAAGPTLAASFGITGALANPVLTLVDSSSRTVATNTGWSTNSNAPTITAMAARVGAFPFPASSADSALLATLDPGAYTALISGANNTTGVSIVEVYDIEALSNESARAINISTRGVAGTGANKLIAGFVIDGASSRRVLIRAVGPALAAAPFNLSGTLAEPQLELYTNRNLLHSSAGAWGLQPNADEIRGAAKIVGAFELADGSKDSAMLVTLLPGAWTVQVGGASGASGVALVEVYVLP